MLLAAFSAANAGLAVWQWLELLVVQSGGKTVCSLGEKVDCAQVWQSDFASRVHGLTGLPIAGLGLQWSLTAVALSLWLLRLARSGEDSVPLQLTVKAWAALGFLSCITFAVASARMGVVCPTCLVTYALTAAFAGVAFAMLPKASAPDVLPLLKALPRALVIAVPLHLVLLYPASRTPHGTGLGAKQALTEQQVLEYFAHLTPPEAQATADARAAWLEAKVPDYPRPPTRQVWGPPDAPLKLVEFTDVLCGHCRALVAMLNELKGAVPKGSFSIEPRYFPLDGECNPHAGNPKGDGVRCLGAKVQICLEGRSEYWDVRDALFENQQSLTVEKIWQLAAERGTSRAELEACVKSPATAEKLQADIAWAMAYGIEGTPLVLLNGKEASGMGPFLFGMAMSGGDPNSKYFAKLPAPR